MEIDGSNRVAKVLDISIGHLPHETVLQIESGSFPKYSLTKGDFGFMFTVPQDSDDLEDQIEDLNIKCESFINIMRRAIELECQYVLFDQDGEYIDDLPQFDW